MGTSLKYDPFILIAGIILGIIAMIISNMISYKSTKKKIIEENTNRIANSPKLLKLINEYIKRDSIIMNEYLSTPYTFDMFIDNCRLHLLSQFRLDYENHIEYINNTNIENPITHLYIYPYFPDIEDKLNVLNKALHTEGFEKLLLHIYFDHIENNIKLAEEAEKEAIEYHKKFGIEPDGDPILHPKENNKSNTEEDIKDVNLDELIKMGTIEEYNNDLKEF